MDLEGLMMLLERGIPAAGPAIVFSSRSGCGALQASFKESPPTKW